MTSFVTRMSYACSYWPLDGQLVVRADPAQSESAQAQATFDVTPIRDLLHLMNTIVEENPDYEATIARFARLDGQAYQVHAPRTFDIMVTMPESRVK